MARDYIEVGIVAERRALDNPWVDHSWRPIGVLYPPPDLAPGTLMSRHGPIEHHFLGTCPLAMFGVETGNYRDNLVEDQPLVWVSVRPTGIDPPLEIVGATADPTEGEMFTELVGDIVEVVPMPRDVAAAFAAFVDANHVEREFFKRKRDRADPQALARRAPGDGSRRPIREDDE